MQYADCPVVCVEDARYTYVLFSSTDSFISTMMEKRAIMRWYFEKCAKISNIYHKSRVELSENDLRMFSSLVHHLSDWLMILHFILNCEQLHFTIPFVRIEYIRFHFSVLHSLGFPLFFYILIIFPCLTFSFPIC